MQRLVVSHGLDGSCVSIARSHWEMATSSLHHRRYKFQSHSIHTLTHGPTITHTNPLFRINKTKVPSFTHYSTNFLPLFYGRLLLLVMTKSIGFCFSCLSLKLYEPCAFWLRIHQNTYLIGHPNSIHLSIDSC